mmetsp:Transcript_15265/g.38536  ORF Transcript_15265/g.38536 Transcript_15265/m.38536 type:complete len:250 (+) Transcript_15265:378-1127(+)
MSDSRIRGACAWLMRANSSRNTLSLSSHVRSRRSTFLGTSATPSPDCCPAVKDPLPSIPPPPVPAREEAAVSLKVRAEPFPPPPEMVGNLTEFLASSFLFSSISAFTCSSDSKKNCSTSVRWLRISCASFLIFLSSFDFSLTSLRMDSASMRSFSISASYLDTVWCLSISNSRSVWLSDCSKFFTFALSSRISLDCFWLCFANSLICCSFSDTSRERRLFSSSIFFLILISSSVSFTCSFKSASSLRLT